MIRITESANATYAAAIKPVRNAMRKYSYESVLNEILYFLNRPEPSSDSTFAERMGWVAERLLLYLFRDKPHCYGQTIANARSVQKLMNLCWKTINDSFASYIEVDQLTLFMRGIMLAQAPFQIGLNPTSFARQIRIVQGIVPQSKLGREIEKIAGMNPTEFFDIAMFQWLLTAKPQAWLTGNYVKDMEKIFGANGVASFFKRICHPVEEFQKRLQSTSAISADEWFQPTPFYRTPCIDWRGNVVPIGRPGMRRFFEAFLSDGIDQCADAQVRQSWEDEVEAYALRTARVLPITVLDESEIRKEFDVREGRVCDMVLIDEDAIVCVEIKSKNLNEKLPAAATTLDLRSRLKATVLSAEGQLLSVASRVRANFGSTTTIYSLVVTSTDLHLGNAEYLMSSKWGEEGLKQPLVISMDSFDWLIEGHRIGKFRIANALEAYTERIQDNPQSLYSIAHMQSESTYQVETPAHLQATVSERIDRILELARSKGR
jgi:hypothetical protein